MVTLMAGEIAITNGNQVISILYDMEKFYDNIDVIKLAYRATECGYPGKILALGLQMHMAVRGLKCDNQFPGDITP